MNQGVAIAIIFLAFACSTDGEDESSAVAVKGYDLHFSTDDFSLHDEQTLQVALISRETGLVVHQDQSTITNGSFNFQWPGVLTEGHSYFIDYYADQNKNGECDDPQIDHSWRQKIDRVQANVTAIENHNLDFTKVCDTFNGTPINNNEGTRAVTVTGSLQLDAGIGDIATLKAGQALEGATIFAAGFQDVEAVTNAAGLFTLSLNLPAQKQAQSITLLMWYTDKSSNEGVITWDPAAIRIGARKELDLSNGSDDISVGTVFLRYTKRASFRVIDSVSNEPQTQCWIEIPSYTFQLRVLTKQEHYKIDYLPPGTYALRANCPGYETNEVTISVEEGTAQGQSEELPDVIVVQSQAL